jgi:hypothetical protein
MADSAVSKFMKDRHEKAKNYKTKHDVERLHHIVAALFYMRDYPQNATLAADLGKEVAGMTAKQAEQDGKDAEEEKKALAEAVATDNKASAEEADESPHRPSGRATSR